MTTQRASTRETFQRNLRMLKRLYQISSKTIAERCGVSERMVDYLLAGERTPTIEVADDLARAFGLNGWQLLLPHLTADLARHNKLEQLLTHYGNASEDGRDHIDMVAAREAKYSA
jgi:transcriptional regulator with XRE-family HTH domain